jgi:hypothetical protein
MDDRDKDLRQPIDLPGGEQNRSRSSFKRGKPKLADIGKNLKKAGIATGLLMVVLIVGFGGFKLYTHFANKPTTPQNSTTEASTSVEPAPQNNGRDIPKAELDKEYISDSLGVTLKYPKAWKVSEANGGMRIESPLFAYTYGGGDKSGNFRIYIRKGARDVDSKYIGRGTAIKPSEKINYASPEPGQRPDTLLTSFGLDTTDSFSFFLIAGNFNLNKNDTLGPNYGKEADTYIIAGGYSSSELTDDLATNSVSPETYDDTNAYKQAIEIIKSLKLH